MFELAMIKPLAWLYRLLPDSAADFALKYNASEARWMHMANFAGGKATSATFAQLSRTTLARGSKRWRVEALRRLTAVPTSTQPSLHPAPPPSNKPANIEIVRRISALCHLISPPYSRSHVWYCSLLDLTAIRAFS